MYYMYLGLHPSPHEGVQLYRHVRHRCEGLVRGYMAPRLAAPLGPPGPLPGARSLRLHVFFNVFFKTSTYTPTVYCKKNNYCAQVGLS